MLIINDQLKLLKGKRIKIHANDIYILPAATVSCPAEKKVTTSARISSSVRPFPSSSYE